MRSRHMDDPSPNDRTIDILETVSDAFLTLDKEYRVTYANKETGRLFKRDVHELIGKPMAELMPVTTSRMFHRYLENAMAHEKPGMLEGFRFVNKIFEVRFYPERSGVIISLHDITTRWHVDELSKLALFVIDRVYEKVFLVRSDGRLFHVNEETCRTLGYTLSELIHMTIFDIVPAEMADDWKDRLNMIKNGGHTAFESILMTKEGGLAPVEVRVNHIILYGVEYYSVTARDIAERKKAEEALRLAHNVLERKVEERTRELTHEKMEAELFLDLMGHDISNMHQIALSQLDMAQELLNENGRLEGDERELIDTSLETLERSARLINNVRKLQRLRKGEYKPEAIDLGALLAEVVEENSSGPGRDITINYAAVKGRYVMANPLLKDLFESLVDNAIKHSYGHVKIEVNVDIVNENGSPFYRVSIEDNGPGIPDEKKAEVFHRLKRSLTQARGTGLGLYIARTLAESFRGHVDVEDRVPGDYRQGSRFLVYLPVAEDEHGQ